jgi:hypothetical protein
VAAAGLAATGLAAAGWAVAGCAAGGAVVADGCVPEPHAATNRANTARDETRAFIRNIIMWGWTKPYRPIGERTLNWR